MVTKSIGKLETEGGDAEAQRTGFRVLTVSASPREIPLLCTAMPKALNSITARSLEASAFPPPRKTLKAPAGIGILPRTLGRAFQTLERGLFSLAKDGI